MNYTTFDSPCYGGRHLFTRFATTLEESRPGPQKPSRATFVPLHHQDTGCLFASSCFRCLLPACKDEMPSRQVQAAMRKLKLTPTPDALPDLAERRIS